MREGVKRIMDSVKKLFLLTQVHELQGVKLDAREGGEALGSFLALNEIFGNAAAGAAFDSEPASFATAMRSLSEKQ